MCHWPNGVLDLVQDLEDENDDDNDDGCRNTDDDKRKLIYFFMNASLYFIVLTPSSLCAKGESQVAVSF